MPNKASLREGFMVVALFLLVCGTRLLGLSAVPPGVNPDEASNGYDAYCLWQTGQDRWGHAWPVLLEGFGQGDQRGGLYAYLCIPFVALSGATHLILAARLPAAIFGVVTIMAFYILVRRISDRSVAFWATLLMAISPWHLQISRIGHEGALTPAFWILILLMLSLAYQRPADDANGPSATRRLGPGWLTAASILVGLAPYAYASMKLFIPAMLLCSGVIYRKEVLIAIRDRRSRSSIVPGAIVFIVVITPMVYLTIHEWDLINYRAQRESLLHRSPTVVEGVAISLKQYLQHFGLTWLFVRGDASGVQSVPGTGQLNWIMLPLLIAGGLTMWRGRKGQRVYALLLAWMLLHPIASAPTHGAPHALRAACGIGVFEWVAGIGAAAIVSRLATVPVQRLAVSLVLFVVIAANGGRTLWKYFVTFHQDPLVRARYQTDLCEAIAEVRDRWTSYDRIFVSDQRSAEQAWLSSQSYIYFLLELPIRPATFHAWDKSVVYRNELDSFHEVESAGPLRFSTRREVLDAHFKKHPDERTLIIARPNEIQGPPPMSVIRGAGGRVRFNLFEIGPQ